HTLGHERVPWLAVRISPQRQVERLYLGSTDQVATPEKPVRRKLRGPDPPRQDVFLRQLLGTARKSAGVQEHRDCPDGSGARRRFFGQQGCPNRPRHEGRLSRREDSAVALRSNRSQYSRAEHTAGERLW